MSLSSDASSAANARLPRWTTLLDTLTVIFALVALSAWVFGGYRLTIPLLGRLSVMDAWRPASLAVVVLIARHLVVRRTPLPVRLARRVTRWWTSADVQTVLPIHLTTRLGVLAIGFLAVVMVGYPASATGRWQIYRNDLLDLPARWDTGWYLGIATDGYEWDATRPTRQQNIAFFPAYPMAIRTLSPFVGRHAVWAGVAISLVAFFVACLYLLRLARDELGDPDAAATAVMLVAAYPFALFYSAAYSESVFLLTIVAAVYHFRRDELWQSMVWGAVAGLTRPNGCFLSVVLGLMAVRPLWSSASWRPVLPPTMGWARLSDRIAAGAAPGLGMVAYSTYIYFLTGNPLQWAAQNAAWGRVYRGLDTIVTDRLDFLAANGLYQYASTQSLDMIYVVTVLFMLSAVWPVYRRFGLPYAAMILVNILPPIAAGGLLSIGRVTSVLFPVFFWLAAAVPPRHRTAWIALFAALQAFAAVLFFTWRPLY